MKESSCINIFAEKLSRLRKAKGWSQPELGDKIGTSGQIISRYERSKITPSIDVVYRLAKLFDVSVDFLLSPQEATKPLEDKKMLDRLQALQEVPPEEKEHFLFIFDAFIRDFKVRKAHKKIDISSELT